MLKNKKDKLNMDKLLDKTTSLIKINRMTQIQRIVALFVSQNLQMI